MLFLMFFLDFFLWPKFLNISGALLTLLNRPCWFRKTHLFFSGTFPCYPYRLLFNDQKMIKIKNSIFYKFKYLSVTLLRYNKSIYWQKFGWFGPLAASLNIKKWRFCHFLAKANFIDNGWIFLQVRSNIHE